MKKKTVGPALILICFIVSASVVYAQLKIPKEKIPSDIHSEVKKQIERLYSSDPVERGYGAYHLGEKREQAVPAIPFLIDVLDDNTSLWWVKAVEVSAGEYRLLGNSATNGSPTSPGEEAKDALVKIGCPAVEPLIAVLKDRRYGRYARKNTVEALGGIGDKRALDNLIVALKDEDPDVRAPAAFALGFMKDEKVVEPLINALGDKNVNVRRYAAMSLIAVGDERASGALNTALKDKDLYIRQYAAVALGKIKDAKAVEQIIAILNDKEGRSDAGNWDGRPVRIEAGFSTPPGSNSNTRGSAALALGDIGGARAIEALIKVLKDDDFTVSMNALLALRKITKLYDFGPVAPLTEEHIKRWEEWWEENKEKFGKEK